MENGYSGTRPLGLSERVVYDLSGTGEINFCMMAEVPNCDLETNLRLLVLRHPLLRATITHDHNGMPAFSVGETPNLNLSYSDESVQQIIERELNTTFPTNECLVRYVYAPTSNTLLITFHHVIGDGMSGIQLLKDLSRIMQGENLDSLPIMPPIDGMSPYQGSKFYTKLVGFIARQMRDMMLGSKKLPISEKDVPTQNRVAHVILGSLDGADKLRNLAKSNDSTVHGVICSAILSALREYLPHSTIGLATAVNLRDSVRPDSKHLVQNQVAFMASMVPSYHRADRNADFWGVARNATSQIHEGIHRGDHWLSVPLPGLLVPKHPKPGQVASRLAGIYPFATLISNLGQIKNIDGVTEVQFTGTMRGMGNGAEIAFTVLTYDNKLYLNASFLEPTLGHKVAQDVHANALNLLGQLIEN